MVVYYKETSRMEVIMGKKVCYVLVRVGERPWCSQDLTVPWETYISEDLDMVDFTELRQNMDWRMFLLSLRIYLGTMSGT